MQDRNCQECDDMRYERANCQFCKGTGKDENKVGGKCLCNNGRVFVSKQGQKQVPCSKGCP